MESISRVLIVDDDQMGRFLLESMLMEEPYQIVSAANGEEALVFARSLVPDLVLLDIMMPGMDGYQVCKALREDPFLSEVPVVMVTALDDHESRLKGIEAGADDFITKPYSIAELRARVKTITRLNRYRSLLEERSKLELAHQALREAYDATIAGWARALEYHDRETEGHSQRVTELAVSLAGRMGLGDQIDHIRRGALLHDIGKMGIPDSILLKADGLTEQEWEVMRMHPEYGFKLLSGIEFLRPALDIPLCHHEQWDGNGYPRNLRGEEIPLAARIFTVVDVYDALRSERPYHEAWTTIQALEYIENLSGKQFDPIVVENFLELMHENDIFGIQHG